MKKIVTGGLMAAVLLFGSTACSQEHEDKRGRGDAPVAGRMGNDSAAFCTNMPDGFGNVCGKCVDHFAPWAVVVTTSTSVAPSQLGLFQAPDQCGGKAVPNAVPVTSGGGAVEPPEEDS